MNECVFASYAPATLSRLSDPTNAKCTFEGSTSILQVFCHAGLPQQLHCLVATREIAMPFPKTQRRVVRSAIKPGLSNLCLGHSSMTEVVFRILRRIFSKPFYQVTAKVPLDFLNQVTT